MNQGISMTDTLRDFVEKMNELGIALDDKSNLIIAKLNWACDSFSETQIRDIANLTMSEYDSSYVSGWIQKLDLNEIWSKVDEWKILHSKTEN